jgi:hypothetical protein
MDRAQNGWRLKSRNEMIGFAPGRPRHIRAADG